MYVLNLRISIFKQLYADVRMSLDLILILCQLIKLWEKVVRRNT